MCVHFLKRIWRRRHRPCLERNRSRYCVYLLFSHTNTLFQVQIKDYSYWGYIYMSKSIKTNLNKWNYGMATIFSDCAVPFYADKNLLNIWKFTHKVLKSHDLTWTLWISCWRKSKALFFTLKKKNRENSAIEENDVRWNIFYLFRRKINHFSVGLLWTIRRICHPQIFAQNKCI